MRIWTDQSNLGLPVPNAREFSNGRLLAGKSDALHLDGLDAIHGDKSVPGASSGFEKDEKVSFLDMVSRSLGRVNELVLESGNLSEKLSSDSSEVEVHKIVTQMAKANMGLGIAKAMIDRAIMGFKDILNQR